MVSLYDNNNYFHHDKQTYNTSQNNQEECLSPKR